MELDIYRMMMKHLPAGICTMLVLACRASQPVPPHSVRDDSCWIDTTSPGRWALLHEAGTPDSAASRGRLAVVVDYGRPPRPIPNATVIVAGNRAAATDSAGKASIDSIARGPVPFSVRAIGYETIRHTIIMRGGVVDTLRVTLRTRICGYSEL